MKKYRGLIIIAGHWCIILWLVYQLLVVILERGELQRTLRMSLHGAGEVVREYMKYRSIHAEWPAPGAIHFDHSTAPFIRSEGDPVNGYRQDYFGTESSYNMVVAVYKEHIIVYLHDPKYEKGKIRGSTLDN